MLVRIWVLILIVYLSLFYDDSRVRIWVLIVYLSLFYDDSPVSASTVFWVTSLEYIHKNKFTGS